MKKMLLLSLLMSLMLSALSCAEHPIETTPAQTTETATATEITSGEIDTTLPEQTNISKAPIFDYTATVIDADGNKVAPYQSSLYFFLDGRVSDGPLMFMRMEDVLPGWIEQGMVPDIALGENSDVNFVCGEHSSITHSGKFRIFVQGEDGTVSKVYESEKTTLAAIYAYGTEHFAGKTVYITYGCMVSDLTNEGDRNDVSCIFRTNF